VSETDQPTLGVATWANFASIRRTIEWVGLDSSRIEKSMYTGATVLRLLQKIAATEELGSEVQEKVAALTEMLSAFDGADTAARTDIIAQARVILDSVIPLGELGARRLDLVAKSRLSKPSRRDRRPRREKPEAANDTAEAEVSSADPEAATKEADSARTEDASGSASASASAPEAEGSAQVEGVEPEAPDVYAWLNLPKTSPGRTGPRAPRRLEWNHPDGTGRPLSALGVLDEDALAVLAGLGIKTISDFLIRPPVSHARAKLAQFSPPGGEDDVDVAELELGSPEDRVMVRGRMVSRWVRMTVNGARHELTLKVRNAGMVRCAWVNGSPRGWSQWAPGLELAFIGTPEEGDEGWNLFQAEPVGVDGRGSGLMPAYGIDGIDEAVLRGVAGQAIGGIMGQLREPLPRKLVEDHKLIGRDEALRDAHFPSNQAGKGRNRLAFEELILLQAGIGWRARSRNPDRGISHKVLHAAVGELGIKQHIRLSDSQEVVFSEIRRDLKSNHAMVRLLQGEVGTNKTTIALLTSAIVMQNKAQVLYVLPDASSAERRFLFSEGIFRSVGIAPALIPDKPNRGQLDAISRGECQIVFGTRSLLENAPKWNKLGLVVVEERNEYGTVDPARLVESGPAPDLLVITDTPIPTSLTLTVFGEYRMSMLPSDEETESCATVFKQADRLDAYALVRETIEEGRQAYVVFPVGEDGDLLGPDDALRYAGALQSDALEGARIGVYCSAMSREDRLRVFEDFQHRRLDVLVATTHIEEAPVVPNATVVVVEHADHHDLARLHRLRGHVGQGLEPGQCLMVMAEEPSDDAQERLNRLSDEQDGFKIAEMDLKERGWDALLGEGAEAPPVFHWADPVLDHQQLLRARDEAFHMVKLDPGMRRSREMVDAVVERWGDWLGHDFSAAQADSQSGTDRAKDQRKGRRRRRRRR
jgi:ATP-dependent DNA helicase RecG